MWRTLSLFFIAIYNDISDDKTEHDLIEKICKNLHIKATIYHFSDLNELILLSYVFDCFIFHTNSNTFDCDIIKDKLFAKNKKAISICIGESHQLPHEIHATYYITEPINEQELYKIFIEIKEKFNTENIIVKLPHKGKQKINIDTINYVNIVKRSICYHLNTGNICETCAIRTSFIKEIHPLEDNKQFLFLQPSLLINLKEIKILHTNYLQFQNNDILYFSQKFYKEILTKWKDYKKN